MLLGHVEASILGRTIGRYAISLQCWARFAGRTPVRPHVDRIFTANSISLGGCTRQQRHRDSIHAGPYLAAKEFRYLSTLMVRAVVYRSVRNNHVWLSSLNSRHWTRLSPHANQTCWVAGACVFGKQSYLLVM